MYLLCNTYYFENFLLSNPLIPSLGNHNKKGSKTKIGIWIMIDVEESSPHSVIYKNKKRNKRNVKN